MDNNNYKSGGGSGGGGGGGSSSSGDSSSNSSSRNSSCMGSSDGRIIRRRNNHDNVISSSSNSSSCIRSSCIRRSNRSRNFSSSRSFVNGGAEEEYDDDYSHNYHRNKKNDEWREGRVISLMKITPLRRIATKISFLASAHLAFGHFNRRSGDVLPYLPDRLSNCDFYWSWKFIDSMSSPLHSAREFLEEDQTFPRVYGNEQEEQEDERQQEEKYHPQCQSNDVLPPPFAVLSGTTAQVSRSLSTIGYGKQVPVISPTAAATYLDGTAFFARTIPTWTGQEFALYFDSLNVSHAVFLFYRPHLSESYHVAVVQAFRQKGISVLAVPFSDNGLEQSQSMEQLAASGYKYVICSHCNLNHLSLFKLAYSHGVMGHPGFTWFLTGAVASEFLTPTFAVNRNDTDLAKAIHGLGVVNTVPPKHQRFQQELLSIGKNHTLQQHFFEHFKHPQLFDNYTFPRLLLTPYTYFAYDAVMALGIAACDTPGLFTGEELFETLLRTQFSGVSGNVSFDLETHGRSLSGITYEVQNIVISNERSTSTHFYFTNKLTSTINMANDSVDELQAFIYTDNTTQPPLPLPALVQKQHRVPLGAHAFGLLLGGFVVFSSIGWMLWTLIYRKSTIVRASQPIFLCQLCVGTIIMGLAVVPLSFQEPTPKHQLDVACMSIPWLLSIGFVTSFSALFSKTWRLNKLFQGSTELRRIRVGPKDVIGPFCSLLIINIILLVAWTVTNPLQWHRVDVSNYDEFGRSQESYGDCNFATGLPFLIPLLMINFVPVLIAAYQSWKAKHLSTELSESSYLAISMASISETTVLAIPVLIAANKNTTASYLLRSSFVCVLSLTILLPIFVPKYRNNRRWEKRRNAGQRSSSIRMSIYRSGSSNGGIWNTGSSNGFNCNSGDGNPQDSNRKRGLLMIRRN